MTVVRTLFDFPASGVTSPVSTCRPFISFQVPGPRTLQSDHRSVASCAAKVAIH